jgi:hypothetical protein
MGPLQFTLVEITGIEPVVPEGGGFTVHCITIDASSPYYLVRLAGIEPARLAARDFKSLVSTYFTTVAISKFGIPSGTRTPTDSFGDCNAAITLRIHSFGGSGEIRTHGAISDSTVFKTVAINRALPHFHNWCPRTDSNRHACALASKTSVSTNFTTRA